MFSAMYLLMAGVYDCFVDTSSTMHPGDDALRSDEHGRLLNDDYDDNGLVFLEDDEPDQQQSGRPRAWRYEPLELDTDHSQYQRHRR